MHTKLALFLLSFFCCAAICSAQAPQIGPTQPDYSSINCSNFVSDQRMPEDMRVVSGEQSNAKMTFITGDMVYINRGLDKGVRVGDRFSVVHKDKDMVPIAWFKWQDKLMKAMGTPYADVGQIKVVDVQPKVSVAQVSLSCDM